MILARSERCTVEDYELSENKVIKRFHCPLMFMNEKFVYDHFPWIAPHCFYINSDEMTILIGKGISLRNWMVTDRDDYFKKSIGKQIIKLSHRLWDEKYIHCDIHADNVVIFPVKIDNKVVSVTVKLIDFEYVHHRRTDSFEKDVDVKGGSFVCAFGGGERSIKTMLGYSFEELNEVKND